MAETDILQDLLESNPNEPVSKGVVLLLRTEMKSEFRTLRQEMDQRFDRLEHSLELIAQNVTTLLAR